MCGKRMFRSVVTMAVLFGSWATCQAAPPWNALGALKPVEADPTQTYSLTEASGPWLIMAGSFSGEGAEKQAHELVQELRKEFKMPAYIYKGRFDLGNAQGKGINEYGEQLKFKYYKHRKKHVELEEIAVLVGDFSAPDDPSLQKTLKKIKVAEPKSLEVKDGHPTYQTLTGWRMLQKHDFQAVAGEKKPEGLSGPAVITRNTQEGPMGHAMITRNPLLPAEFFAKKNGVEEDIVRLNAGVPFSLLDCPGKYTVQVATFKGHVVVKQEDIQAIEEGRMEMPNTLAKAAEKADILTKALRQKGYEAYQFHDRSSSIVTVGSFDSAGTPRGDGKIDVKPEIQIIIRTFGAGASAIPGQPGGGIKKLADIDFDVQPMPIEVPKRSVSVALKKNALQ